MLREILATDVFKLLLIFARLGAGDDADAGA